MKGNMTDQELKEQAEVMLAYANAPEGKKPRLLIRSADEGAWFSYGGNTLDVSERTRYRLAPSPIAPGHNPDKLTVDQIPEGRRLMTEEEFQRRYDVIGCEISQEIRAFTSGGYWSEGPHRGNHPRTTYSVPIDWKDPLLKKKVRKPCGPEHFPPGTVVCGVNWPEHCCSDVVSRTQQSIVILIGVNCSVSTMRYENMLPGHLDDHMIRSLDNGKTWLPCYVEVEE